MTESDPSSPDPEHQTRIRRATQKLQLPLVSGVASVLALCGCFVVAAAIVMVLGMVFELPPWIRFEIMLAAWWLVWIAMLGHLLFHGKRISQDHVYTGPRNWFGRAFVSNSKGGGGSSGGGWGDAAFAGADLEGCLWGIGIVLASIVVLLLAWLLIEIVIPVLALILYALIRAMLARVANDHHGCQGRFGAALLWGTMWATLYTAPLALLVWVVHLIVAHKAGAVG